MLQNACISSNSLLSLSMLVAQSPFDVKRCELIGEMEKEIIFSPNEIA